MWCPICEAYTQDIVSEGTSGVKLTCANAPEGVTCGYSVSFSHKMLSQASYTSKRLMESGKQ